MGTDPTGFSRLSDSYEVSKQDTQPRMESLAGRPEATLETESSSWVWTDRDTGIDRNAGLDGDGRRSRIGRRWIGDDRG